MFDQSKPQKEKVIIIGAGPCGLAAAIALQEKGIDPLIIEKGNVVDTISRYPTHQVFFSSAEKLEIGDIPFAIDERKPNRLQALAYYRRVAALKNIRINAYERVDQVVKEANSFHITTSPAQQNRKRHYEAEHVIIATGYYDNHNKLNVPGADLPKVKHYFHEAHPYYNQDVVVLGGKNSAVDAALELEKVGARVTVLYRGETYSSSVKPWILPEFDALVRHGKIQMVFNSTIEEITPTEVIYKVKNEANEIKIHKIKNNFVFAMIGYHPDHSFLTNIGVEIEAETGRPIFNPETMETNVENLFIAGVIAAGNNANEIFIENGRFHGELIANSIIKK